MTTPLNPPGLLQAAEGIARMAHHGQQRKYTSDPYVIHCAEVARTVELFDGDPWLQAVGWLHDTVEDTDVSLLNLDGIFPAEVVEGVDYMTERAYPTLNRAKRKDAERLRLAAGRPAFQTVKLIDLACNTASIVEHDPNFARVFLVEAWALHRNLTDAWIPVRDWAGRLLQEQQYKHDRGLLDDALDPTKGTK